MDTLRADRLGCYGAAAAASPRIDALAAQGVVFDNAACPMPLTRPSHFSMMTGLYPRRARRREQPGRAAASRRSRWRRSFRRRVPHRGFRRRAAAGRRVRRRPGVRACWRRRPVRPGRRTRWRAGPSAGWARRRRAPRAVLPLGPPVRPAHALRASAGVRCRAAEDARRPRPGRGVLAGLTALAGGRAARSRGRRSGARCALYDGEVAFADQWVGRLLDAWTAGRTALRPRWPSPPTTASASTTASTSSTRTASTTAR